MDDAFDTLDGTFQHETPPVKGSRFLANAAHVADDDAVERFLEEVRAMAPNASHHCWAFRLGRPCDRFRSGDDGEPGGSAGRPILAQIEGHGLTDTIVVVTRWFGGTKLGVGGLMRAYGGCAGKALDLAPRCTVLVTERLHLTLPYECEGALQGLFAARGLTPENARYGVAIDLTIDVPRRDRLALEAELRDRTAGRIRVREADDLMD